MKFPKMDKTAFSSVTFEEREKARKKYWQNKSVAERMSALETMRQILFGYDPATTRLERFFEVVKRK